MNLANAQKLRDAEASLKLRIPKKLFDILRKAEDGTLFFGESKWLLPGLPENNNKGNENFFIQSSEEFSSKWNLKALIFATNEHKDLLLLLEGKEGKMLKEVFILPANTKELKIFNYTLEKLLLHGPLDYSGWEAYYYKLEDGKLRQGGEYMDENGEELQ